MISSVWVEKYRPKNIDEYIATDEVKKFIKDIYETKHIPNMTLCSPKAGSGKTSLAKMLARDFCDEDEVLFINGSLNRNIDTIRNEMTDFVYKPTISGNRKVIIIDEADGINRIAQDSLRGFIEQWQEECAFILTCNEVSRIIPAIISRCPVVNLTAKTVEDKKGLALQVFERCKSILHDNLIPIEDEEALKDIVRVNFPDIRQIINVLQRVALSGGVSKSAVDAQNNKKNQILQDVELAILEKQWGKIREWAHNNYQSQNIYNDLYNDLIKKIDISNVPEFIILTGEYSYRASLTNFSEINLAAYLAEIAEKVKLNV